MAPGVYFSDPGAESSPTVGKNEGWGHLFQRVKSRFPRTFTLYTQEPPKGAASDLQTWVQPLGLPYPPSGDFNCKVTKSSPKPPSRLSEVKRRTDKEHCSWKGVAKRHQGMEDSQALSGWAGS